MSKTTKMIAQMLRAANRKKTSAYDTTAEVVRVDGDTVWVHIPGGVEETPVRKTIDANEGDTVQVRVSGGSAFLVGNRTAPPTDDTTAKEAKDTADDAEEMAEGAWDIADEAMDAADDAWDKADFALQSANGKNKVYYASSEPEEPEEGFSEGDTWFDTANDYQINEWNGEEWVPFQLGEDAIADLSITNAKIANGTIQAAKIGSVDVGSLTGGYINAGHINTLELVVGNDKTLGDAFDEYDDAFEDIDTEMSDMADDIDDIEATANTALSEANQVYPYMTYINSTYGVRVYRGDKSNADNQKYYSQMNAGGFDVVANNVNLAHIGYGSGVAQSGTDTAPYYTLGTRASDTSSTRGNYSVAEGYYTTASGYASHAEGYSTTASGQSSHAEGQGTNAYAFGSHAEGSGTGARGTNSHAEGSESAAFGVASHAEGTNTDASGHSSHAEGQGTQALGATSHAGGFHTIASYDCQTVIGQYNNNKSTNAFEIGYGTSSTPSNALAVDWNGKLFTKQIQTGSISSASVASGSIRTVTVTFDKAMSGTPHVVASLYSSSQYAETGSISVGVSDISTTGFTCKIFNNSSRALSPAVQWIAVNVGLP